MANRKNRYYVYVYSDPETHKPFYVGKGTRDRVWSHLNFKRAITAKQKKIKSILDKGLRPIVELVQWDLTQDEAFKVEAAFIQYFGVENLCNEQDGNGTPKIHADFLEYLERSGKLRTKKRGRRVLFLNVSDFYYPGISRFQLYDAARGNLHVRECDRDLIENDCRLVLAVHQGIVIDVYVNPYCTPAECDMREHGREEEEGSFNITAGEPTATMRNKYVGLETDIVFGSRRYRLAYL